MINTLLGIKKEMSQAFVQGSRVPVTMVHAGPCIVAQIKSGGKDGYQAVQLGFGSKKIKNTTKPLQGHLRGVIKDKTAPRFLREVRVDRIENAKVGDTVLVSDVFKKGDVVSVTGTSKGKGFQGVVKRWGFKGGPRTHGQSDRLRAPGSIGQGTTPGRVRKGKKMPGRMGTDTVTIKNLYVVDVDEDKNILVISGLVPGRKGGLLEIKKLRSGKLEDLVKEEIQVQVQEAEVDDEPDREGEVKEEILSSKESEEKE